MLHYTRNKNVLAITYGIDLYFLSDNILIYKYRMLLDLSVDDIHKLLSHINVFCGLKQFGEAYDGIQRSTDFMAHIC